MLSHFALERSRCETSGTCGDNLNKQGYNLNSVPFGVTLNPAVTGTPDRIDGKACLFCYCTFSVTCSLKTLVQ